MVSEHAKHLTHKHIHIAYLSAVLKYKRASLAFIIHKGTEFWNTNGKGETSEDKMETYKHFELLFRTLDHNNYGDIHWCVFIA